MAAADWTRRACPQCACDRLACPWGEELADGAPIVCGGCGGLAVFEVRDDSVGTDPAEQSVHWRIRLPSLEEASELYADEQVKAWRDAYHLDTLRRAGAGRRPRAGAPQVVTRMETGLDVGFRMTRRET